MADLFDLLAFVMQIVTYLAIYFTIIVHTIDLKSNEERFKFILIVVGIFVILFLSEGKFSSFFFNPQWPFMFTQLILMTYLSFVGIDLIIGKKTVLILFIIFLVGLTSNAFIAFMIGAAVYLILATGFIIYSFKTVFKWLSGRF